MTSRRETWLLGKTMTCRIDRVLTDKGVTLCISGEITGPEVDTVRTALEQEDKAVVVDLQHVLLVDGQAAKFLALCEMKGIEFKNCPAYIREWVARERAQMKTDRAK
jgi:hypothetical protein